MKEKIAHLENLISNLKGYTVVLNGNISSINWIINAEDYFDKLSESRDIIYDLLFEEYKPSLKNICNRFSEALNKYMYELSKSDTILAPFQTILLNDKPISYDKLSVYYKSVVTTASLDLCINSDLLYSNIIMENMDSKTNNRIIDYIDLEVFEDYINVYNNIENLKIDNIAYYTLDNNSKYIIKILDDDNSSSEVYKGNNNQMLN